MNKLNYHTTLEILGGASQEEPRRQLGDHKSLGMNQLFPFPGKNEGRLICGIVDL